MMKYASDLPDFADLLRAAADWKHQRNAIVEKDYYLIRFLGRVREQSPREILSLEQSREETTRSRNQALGPNLLGYRPGFRNVVERYVACRSL
jgi:hypothetical protein